MPPKWLINALPLPPLWFYEQNLSRCHLQNSLFTLPQSYCLATEKKKRQNRHKYIQYSPHLCFFSEEDGMSSVTLRVGKTNMRARRKLPVNRWKERASSATLSQSSTLTSPCSPLSVVWSNVGVRDTGSHQCILMRDEVGQLPRLIVRGGWR